MTGLQITSFEAFWPYYVRAHQKPLTRALHYLGTFCALGCVAAGALALQPMWLLAAPAVGYGAAWLGHFLVEGNRPATFGHALYSFMADFKMLRLALRGQMAAEVERCVNAPSITGAPRQGTPAA
ncbi:MAG: DUF962 domain-containing protein [Myxococcales bacterium]